MANSMNFADKSKQFFGKLFHYLIRQIGIVKQGKEESKKTLIRIHFMTAI